MKNRMNRILTVAAALSTTFFAACSESDTADTVNRAYLLEAEGLTTSTSFVIPETGTTVTLTPRITQQAQTDVELELYVDPEGLARYNTANGTNYEVIDDSHLTFSETRVKIPAGKAVAAPVTIKLTPLTNEENKSGISYALPVSVRAVNGDIQTSRSSGTYVFSAIPVPISDVPALQKYCTMQLPLAENFVAEEWTFEMLFNPSSVTASNITCWAASAVGVNMAGGADNIQSGFMLRLGDAGQNPPGTCLNGRIQFAQRGVGKIPLVSNLWHHIAIVVKAGTVTVYVNGVPDYSLAVPATNPNVEILAQQGIRLAGENRTGTNLLSTTRYRYAQVRLWKEARSVEQLNSNRYGVPENSPNLFGYWKLNSYTEGKATVNKSDTDTSIDGTAETREIDTYFFEDATGHNPDGFIDRNPDYNTGGLEFVKDKRIEVGYNFDGKLPEN